MTVTLLATCDSGVGVRVALMTTVSAADSSASAAAAGADAAAVAVANMAKAKGCRERAEDFCICTRDSAATFQQRRRNGFSRSHQHTPAGNRTTARGGCPGSRVMAFVLLPKAGTSVDSGTFARRSQLRGQPRLQALAGAHTTFRFESLAGTSCVARIIREWA